MSRYKDIDLYTKILRKEIRDIKNFENSMYRKGKRNGLILAKAIVLDGERIPTADVAKVVRCKDCKYFLDKQRKNHQGICMCWEKDTSYDAEFYPYADDFCSYGERKEEE